jgi:HK97 family phage prohead protease
MYEEKTIPSFVKTIEGRVVVGYPAVMGNVDETNDRTLMGAFLKTFKERLPRGQIKHFWMHQMFDPPTAAILSAREVGKEDLPKEMISQFPEITGAVEETREYLQNSRSDQILEGIIKKAITEMSFGYDAIRSKDEVVTGGRIRNLVELKAYDFSDVNWGANPATRGVKAAIPFADHGAADEGLAWKKPNLGDFTDKQWDDLDDAERRRITAHYAWSANSPAEKFEDLKLPHHLAKKSGVGPAVWNGVRSAMSVLMGGMGGVEIPEGERKPTYNHLAKHYPAWEKEPPDFKLVSLAFLTREIAVPGDFAVGCLLANDLERLDRALKEFQGILLSAEPSAEDECSMALTERLRMQLEIREREILQRVR